MTILDGIFVIIILLTLMRGLVRGLVKELTFIVALVLAFLVAWSGSAPLRLWMNQIIPDNPQLAATLSYVIVFIAVFLLVLFLGIACRHMLHSLWLGGVDRLGGALLGMIKGVLLCGVITLLLMTVFSQDAGMLRSSRMAPYMVRISGEMSSYIPDHLKKKFRQTAAELQTAWQENGIPHWFESEDKGES
ncbi:MAG: CvpA family protein [Desulfohalobiaceae bacterium]|nr:CvpA family protein [Desulfohalobiaceae bacterium]